MQAMKRDCIFEHVKNNMPAGKGAKKEQNTDLDEDELSRKINALQLPVLVRLGLHDVAAYASE